MGICLHITDRTIKHILLRHNPILTTYHQPPVTSSSKDRSILMRSGGGDEIWLRSPVHKQYISIKVQLVHKQRDRKREPKEWQQIKSQRDAKTRKTTSFKRKKWLKKYGLNKCRAVQTNQILVIKTLNHCCLHHSHCNKPPLAFLQAIMAYLKRNRLEHENQPAALSD